LEGWVVGEKPRAFYRRENEFEVAAQNPAPLFFLYPKIFASYPGLISLYQIKQEIININK
jgi:hypothetical protein